MNNGSNKHFKKIASDWLRNLSSAGAQSWFSLLMLISLGGFTNLFSSPTERPIFGDKITVKMQILDKFYMNNYNLYLIDYGLYKEAKKNGINFDESKSIEYIKKIEIFQTNKVFDSNKYKKFLEDNKLENFDILNYAHKKCCIEQLQKILKFLVVNKNYIEDLKEKKFNATVSGNLYIIDNTFLQDDITITQKDLKKFILEAYKNKRSSYLLPAKVSGKVYYIDKNRISLDVLNEKIANKNFDITEEKLKRIYNLNFKTKVYKDATIETDDNTFVFFENTKKFYESYDYYIIAEIDDMTPSYINYNEMLANKELKLEIQRFKLTQIAQEKVEEFNIKKITERDLEKTFRKNTLTITSDDDESFENCIQKINSASVRIGGSNNYIGVFIPKNVQVNGTQENDEFMRMLKKMMKQYNLEQNDISFFINNIMNYWINQSK